MHFRHLNDLKSCLPAYRKLSVAVLSAVVLLSPEKHSCSVAFSSLVGPLFAVVPHFPEAPLSPVV